MTADEIRNKWTDQNPDFHYDLKAQILQEIAVQLATMVGLMEKKNALLGESVSLSRESLTHQYEHNTAIVKSLKADDSEEQV